MKLEDIDPILQDADFIKFNEEMTVYILEKQVKHGKDNPIHYTWVAARSWKAAKEADIAKLEKLMKESLAYHNLSKDRYWEGASEYIEAAISALKQNALSAREPRTSPKSEPDSKAVSPSRREGLDAELKPAFDEPFAAGEKVREEE